MAGARDMMVVDAHVHFWDPAALRYPWLSDVPALSRSFLPHDYPDDDVHSTVFVEANCAPHENVDEVDFVERLASFDPRIAGTVAYVDMHDEQRRANVLKHLSRIPRVVGVRHNIQGTPPASCLDPHFVRGVRAVGRQGYTFDLCATADQLGDVALLVDRCPETNFVLDHCGKPAIRNDAFEDWARALRRISLFANVACKLSGLLTEARADQRDARSLAPYIEHACTCFGATRVLYGSDWPVVSLADGLNLWRSIVEQLTSHWSIDDRQRLFAGNALRLYRLAAHADA